MESSFKPLTKAQRTDLEGYVWWPIWLFRAVLFVAPLAALAGLVRVLQRDLAGGHPVWSHPAWWVVPVAALGLWLYRVAGRWTGGRRLRAAIRADLGRGEAAVHRVKAVDAIEVDEQEDEGPSFFILTDDGRTMLFSGQYLDRLKGRGFPFTAFDIVEAPESKIFFGILKAGEPLVPSARRPPFTWEETKQYGVNKAGKFHTLDVDFAALKASISGEEGVVR